MGRVPPVTVVVAAWAATEVLAAAADLVDGVAASETGAGGVVAAMAVSEGGGVGAQAAQAVGRAAAVHPPAAVVGWAEAAEVPKERAGAEGPVGGGELLETAAAEVQETAREAVTWGC